MFKINELTSKSGLAYYEVSCKVLSAFWFTREFLPIDDFWLEVNCFETKQKAEDYISKRKAYLSKN